MNWSRYYVIVALGAGLVAFDMVRKAVGNVGRQRKVGAQRQSVDQPQSKIKKEGRRRSDAACEIPYHLGGEMDSTVVLAILTMDCTSAEVASRIETIANKQRKDLLGKRFQHYAVKAAMICS